MWAQRADAGARSFADILLRLGKGETEAVSPQNFISLHSFGILADDISTPFSDTIYPEIEFKYVDTWLLQRAIRVPYIDSVIQINKL